MAAEKQPPKAIDEQFRSEHPTLQHFDPVLKDRHGNYHATCGFCGKSAAMYIYANMQLVREAAKRLTAGAQASSHVLPWAHAETDTEPEAEGEVA